MRKILVSMLLALACTVHAAMITGWGVGVTAGDSVTVLDARKMQHKIRLAGVDASEPKQAFGTGCGTAIHRRTCRWKQ